MTWWYVAAAMLAILALPILLGPAGPRWSLAIATLVLFLVPIYVGTAGSGLHRGTGPETMGVASYWVASLLLLVRLKGSGRRPRIGPYVSALALFFTVGVLLGIWPQSDILAPGVLHFLAGTVVLAAGLTTGALLERDPDMRKWLATALLIIVGVQAFVAALQLAGFPINPVSRSSAEFVSGRVSGTTSHPNTLGKLLFLAAMMALPLTGESLRRTRRMAWGAIGLSLVVIGLSGGRANFAAAIVLVLAWAVFNPSAKLSAKFSTLLGSLAVTLAFAGYFIERQRQDPGGGSRRRLEAVASTLTTERPWYGVGPNRYVEAGSGLDAMTASGFPVHNAYLLIKTEIGIVGAILLLGPLVYWGVRAIIRTRGRGTDWHTRRARALLGGTPGLLLIGLTGWGLASGQMYALWMFTIGFLIGEARVPGASGGRGAKLRMES